MLLRPSNLARLGVPAGFSTRQGGVSAPPFDALNFGNPGELPPGVSRDPAANIAENFRRVAQELGCPGRAIIQVHQIHGSAVHVHEPAASDGTSTSTAWERTITGADPKADAIVTRDAGALIAIRVADCTPILLASADGTIVAAVHAGWRGVIAGVVVEAVRSMRAHGARQIHAAIGPCIGPDQFEVGPEVVAEFRRVFGAAAPVRERPGNKGDVDLQAALALQLHAEGIDDVETLRHCTASDATRFFSHRRDRGVTGRMIGIIGPRAAQ
jgi:YfiH family protein